MVQLPLVLVSVWWHAGDADLAASVFRMEGIAKRLVNERNAEVETGGLQMVGRLGC